MGKIVVKIVTKTPNGSTAGQVDYNMLRPLKADVVLDTATAGTTGGILPITQAEYDRVVA